MSRFAVGAAAVFALCRADEWGQPKPGEFGYDDTKNKMWEYPNPKSMPGHDKCGVDCYRICGDGLGRKGRNMVSYSDCHNSCYAHTIETPHQKSHMWDTNRQQGKYIQKVMAEYCDRGVCGAGLVQAAAVQEHQHNETGAYSPGAHKGDPRAMPSGWPSGCESETYYCQEACQNLYHKPTSDIGEHPGASEKHWSRDLRNCKSDCGKNFKAMTKYWDEWCTCYKSKDGDMKLEKVPGLLQQEQEQEPELVDVGAFMQLPAEL